MIKNNLELLMQRIRVVANRCGRQEQEITLVGVTKFASISAVNEALSGGLVHIAENRVHLVSEKFSHLDSSHCEIKKHLIGHLQTNKVKDAVRFFNLIQSVDSLKLAIEIDKRAGDIGKIQDILIQLNISKESQKFGLSGEFLDSLVYNIRNLSHIRLLGLMTMAPQAADRECLGFVFGTCREYFQKLSSCSLPNGSRMQYLSMGMSGDYIAAIEEGSNMLRIGSAIFDTKYCSEGSS